jgi:hypothetical protein
MEYKVHYSTGIGSNSEHGHTVVTADSREEARDIVLRQVKFVNSVSEI